MKRRRCAIAFFPMLLLAVGWSAHGQSNADETGAPVPSRWSATSENAIFRLDIGPDSGAIELGKFQVWTLHLTDADGAPIYPARFAIGGGMLGHGHGLPTQPRVTGYRGEGLYQIDGMKFNMAGDWSIYFVIETDRARDQAKVDLTVDY